jgi:hypothetical protein
MVKDMHNQSSGKFNIAELKLISFGIGAKKREGLFL